MAEGIMGGSVGSEGREKTGRQKDRDGTLSLGV